MAEFTPFNNQTFILLPATEKKFHKFLATDFPTFHKSENADKGTYIAVASHIHRRSINDVIDFQTILIAFTISNSHCATSSPVDTPVPPKSSNQSITSLVSSIIP